MLRRISLLVTLFVRPPIALAATNNCTTIFQINTTEIRSDVERRIEICEKRKKHVMVWQNNENRRIDGKFINSIVSDIQGLNILEKTDKLKANCMEGGNLATLSLNLPDISPYKLCFTEKSPDFGSFTFFIKELLFSEVYE
jgi:hypothetical protein